MYCLCDKHHIAACFTLLFLSPAHVYVDAHTLAHCKKALPGCLVWVHVCLHEHSWSVVYLCARAYRDRDVDVLLHARWCIGPYDCSCSHTVVHPSCTNWHYSASKSDICFKNHRIYQIYTSCPCAGCTGMANKNQTFCGPPPLYCNATEAQCTNFQAAAKVKSWAAISKNETVIAQQLVRLGPLSVAMDATGLEYYTSGIWNPTGKQGRTHPGCSQAHRAKERVHACAVNRAHIYHRTYTVVNGQRSADILLRTRCLAHMNCPAYRPRPLYPAPSPNCCVSFVAYDVTMTGLFACDSSGQTLDHAILLGTTRICHSPFLSPPDCLSILRIHKHTSHGNRL
jgi:hypothetical protein